MDLVGRLQASDDMWWLDLFRELARPRKRPVFDAKILVQVSDRPSTLGYDSE